MSRKVRRVGKTKSAFLIPKIKAFDAIALKATQENHVVSHIRNQPAVQRVTVNRMSYLLAILVSR